MSKSTGFMLYESEPGRYRPVAERLKDWQPIQLTMPRDQLTRQATRCMDCGTPFCHQGQIINKMTTGCPLNNLIPEWNDLIYRNLWQDAYVRLSKTNNFPEFTGLTCPAPCEHACTLGIDAPPVTIKSIEYAIIERAFDEGWVQPNVPTARTGKSVAVIGSGPAGLACADQLNSVGHHVTVFERDDRIGGLLMYGIPNMKLAKSMVERRIGLLREAGIAFKTGIDVGVDVPISEIQTEFDAIILCTGAIVPRDLPVPGRELKGIHFAMDYLRHATKQLLDAPNVPFSESLSAQDKDVIVIGGGDTGTDCVATALRQGCRSLTQFEIMQPPPSQRQANNPWPQWERIYRWDYGHSEAAEKFGSDPRRYQIMTESFQSKDGQQLAGLKTVELSWREESHNGQSPFEAQANSEKEWPTQLVLLALGFQGVEHQLLEQCGLTITSNGTIATDGNSHATAHEGIFAAGDSRRGQSIVVWAIKEGRDAARECDQWLMGETNLP